MTSPHLAIVPDFPRVLARKKQGEEAFSFLPPKQAPLDS